jgi:hypothetical protein
VIAGHLPRGSTAAVGKTWCCGVAPPSPLCARPASTEQARRLTPVFCRKDAGDAVHASPGAGVELSIVALERAPPSAAEYRRFERLHPRLGIGGFREQMAIGAERQLDVLVAHRDLQPFRAVAQFDHD